MEIKKVIQFLKILLFSSFAGSIIYTMRRGKILHKVLRENTTLFLCKCRAYSTNLVFWYGIKLNLKCLTKSQFKFKCQVLI